MKRLAVLALCLTAVNVSAFFPQQDSPPARELPPDVRKMLESMPPEFRELFEEAFEDPFFDADEFDESLGPEQRLDFRRARRSIELAELRNRRVDPLEKLSARNLAPYKPLLEPYRRSVLTILDEGSSPRALATVVDAEGLLVTKASEVQDAETLTAELGNERYAAKLVSTNERFDLALLQIEGVNLQAVVWPNVTPAVGSLLVSGDAAGSPFASGVVSVAARPLMDRGRAFLGVEPVTVVEGVLLRVVQPGSSAEKAGLQDGDIVTEFDGREATTSHDFANRIRFKQPGDTLKVSVLREGMSMAFDVALGELPSFAARGPFRPSEMGADLSQRMSDFDLAFQHDMPLWPEQCGGPLIGLDGKVVGLNIARSGRVRSYAIPSSKMAELVAELIKDAKTSL